MTARATFLFHRHRLAAIEQRAAFEKVYVHEAAHAVIGAHFGLTIAALCAGMPASGPLPHGRCQYQQAPLAALPLTDELVVVLAGGEADAKFSGRDTTSGDDLHTVVNPVLRHCRGDQHAALEMIMAGRRRAGQLVERFWPQIRALADALADHGGAMSAMQIAPFLAGIPKATPYARGDAPPVRSPQSPPPERARPAPPPSDLITRSAGFTPRVVLEIRHYGERIGDVIEIVPGKFMPWSRREERFVGGTFTDRHAAARML